MLRGINALCIMNGLYRCPFEKPKRKSLWLWSRHSCCGSWLLALIWSKRCWCNAVILRWLYFLPLLGGFDEMLAHLIYFIVNFYVKEPFFWVFGGCEYFKKAFFRSLSLSIGEARRNIFVKSWHRSLPVSVFVCLEKASCPRTSPDRRHHQLSLVSFSGYSNES